MLRSLQKSNTGTNDVEHTLQRLKDLLNPQDILNKNSRYSLCGGDPLVKGVNPTPNNMYIPKELHAQLKRLALTTSNPNLVKMAMKE